GDIAGVHEDAGAREVATEDAPRDRTGIGARARRGIDAVEIPLRGAEVERQSRPPGLERVEVAHDGPPASREQVAREGVLALLRVHDPLAAGPGEDAVAVREVEVAELAEPVVLAEGLAAVAVDEVLELDAVKGEDLVAHDGIVLERAPAGPLVPD